MVTATSYSDIEFKQGAQSAGYTYEARHYMNNKEFRKVLPLIEACLKRGGVVLKSMVRQLLEASK
jgi:hypothetical protein